MSKRKNAQKALVLNRETQTFETSWISALGEVPIWDSSRGFPLSEPPLEIEVYDRGGGDLEALKRLDPLVKTPNDSDLEALRRLLDKPEWEPTAAPEQGYPRLVRKTYLEPSRTVQHSSDVQLLNDVSALTRYSSIGGKPDKRMLREIEELHGRFGAVYEPQHNTLASWLDLAAMIQAHFDIRFFVDEFGFEDLLTDLAKRRRDALRDRDAVRQLTYRPMFLKAREVVGKAKREALFRTGMATHLRERFGKVLKGAQLKDDFSLVVRSSLFEWVSYELSLFWDDSFGVAECRGCERLFYPGRGGKNHCHARCRVLKKDKAGRERQGA